MIVTLVLGPVWGIVAGAVMAMFVAVMLFVIPSRLRHVAATNPYE